MSLESGNSGDGTRPWNNRPTRPKPVTVEEKLDDIIKRLGRVEKHLIDLKGNPPPPGQMRYHPVIQDF